MDTKIGARWSGRHRNESGFAMILAMVVTLILSLITVALANISAAEYSTAATLDASSQALLAAEAGGELGVSILREDADWSDNATTASWTVLATGAFPSTGTPVGQIDVQLQHDPALDARTNIIVRALGQVRGATRTIQFILHRTTGADFTTYSIETVNITNVSGGGSLQWHGSAYFEQDLIFKGGAQAGFYNDRRVLSTDPGFFNHLYVCGWNGATCSDGDLDIDTGNPTIGDPYHWVHVTDQIIGSSVNYNVSNRDFTTPDPFYPDVLQGVRDALTTPGNSLQVSGGMRFVACSLGIAGWQTQLLPDLRLVSGDPFYLPTAGTSCPGAADSRTIADIRADPSLYTLIWEPTRTPNLTYANPNLPIYIPGRVVVGVDVRYEHKGTLVVANQATATTPGALQPQSGCAVDFNTNGSCNGTPNTGHAMRASISPCLGSPGTDNPSSTFPSVDLAAIIVNGGMYSNLNATSCGQEMNLVMIVGDRNAPAAATCASRASVSIQRKLQWYGVLMTREICLDQVPDFWQVPDLSLYLPPPVWDAILNPTNPVQTRNWRELFSTTGQ